MKHSKLFKRISTTLMGFGLLINPVIIMAGNGSETTTISEEAQKGMDLFQGKVAFENGGPSCISCHNVSNDHVAPGGGFAMDLTDYFSREGSLNESVGAWLAAPSPPAMATTYESKPLSETERLYLTEFLRYADANKPATASSKGQFLMLMGGGGGFVILLIVITILWRHRKQKMVKEAIFSRQKRSLDAKF
ncbi:MAG: hypothetical protein H6598_04670 [Flavobacteriales bacterium]|nr:hypothetical protein [Flavobacteriales bacterium]